jgi:hypothetical protein
MKFFVLTIALLLSAMNGSGYEFNLNDIPDVSSPEYILGQIAPGAEILGNKNVTDLGSLENATQMKNSVDRYFANPIDGNYTAYRMAVSDYQRSAYAAIDAGKVIKGVAETSYPNPEYVPFMVIRNVTIGTGAPDLVVILARECPGCNLGNTHTADGVYIRAKAYLYNSGKCKALDGSDSLNLTLVRFWLM